MKMKPGTNRARVMRPLFCMGIAAAALCLTSCTSVGGRGAPAPVGKAPPAAAEAACRTLTKADLNRVIDGRLGRQDAAHFLSGISIQDYDIADPGTNWLCGAVPGAPEGVAVYYFTYRQRYIILLLKDRKDGCADTLDALVIPRTSDDYEIGMGPVEVNGDHRDPDVIVIYNKHWKGAFTEDITAAFKPNWDTGKLESFTSPGIRIYREE